MQTGSPILDGTYMQKVIQLFPEYTTNDFWSLILCGADLDDPYRGWSGFVAAPIFSDLQPLELFFGDFPDSLAQYENIPPYRISRDVSRSQAFSELRSFFESISDHPVFVSSNAARWSVPIITQAVQNSVEGPWNAQIVDLRDLYSITREEIPLRGTRYLGELFTQAPPLPKRFGLNAIASALDVSVPDSSTKALYRARLTAEVAVSCLTSQYPLQ